MKQSLSPRSVKLIAISLVLLVGAGVLGWMGIGELMGVLSRAEELGERKGRNEIAAILSRAGGIGAAKKEADDAAKLGQDLTQHVDGLISPWRQAWLEASGDGKDWAKDPNKWKDKLVHDNDEILKQCGRVGNVNRVALGPNFYLGLEDFKQRSPSAEQVPDLARRLCVAKRLVDLLILAKKVNEGYATPCLLQGLEIPGLAEAGNQEAGKGLAKTGDKNPEIFRERYRVKAECSPEVLYEYVRLLWENDWLFIVSDLKLVNTKEAFPKRGEIAKLFEKAPNPQGESNETVRGSGEKTEVDKLLLVLSGKEQIQVTLDIDFVGWKPALSSAKAATPKK